MDGEELDVVVNEETEDTEDTVDDEETTEDEVETTELEEDTELDVVVVLLTTELLETITGLRLL